MEHQQQRDCTIQPTTKRTSFYVLLEQAEDEDGEGGEGDVVEGQVDAVV